MMPPGEKQQKLVFEKGTASCLRIFALVLGISALAGCSDTPGPSSAAVAGPVRASEQVVATKRKLRLLSQVQFFNTVGSLFGRDVVPNVTFAPFQRTEGLLATGAAYEGMSEAQMDLYQRSASIIADAVVADDRRNFLISCKPAKENAADDACARKFLSAAGQRLFRRPLSEQKLEEVVTEAGNAANRLEDFYAGLSLALEGLLLSPRTLYIEEVTEPGLGRHGQRRLDGYSLASRLSFFLWNQAPDEALLKAAASGELHTAEGRARSIDRMLQSPKLEAGVRAFFDDMFGFDNFETLAKDATVYPAFTGLATSDAREQTLRLLVDHLIVRKKDYRDIFTTRDTFISQSLAPLYQVPAGLAWTHYQSPAESPRVGLLTQISFLALYSHPGRSSPTLRGKALRELLMCQPVPRPPANVDFSALENPDPRLRTARERLSFHSENPVCAGCHKITDSIGLALENFDGSGQYRESERGAAIDASGVLDGKLFNNAAELGRALHDHPAVTACVVRRLYAYGLGGKLRREDQPQLDYLNASFSAGGYTFPNLLRAIALSESFAAIDGGADESRTAELASAQPALAK